MGSTAADERDEQCIALVMPRHWERALVRAELIERGHDAVGLLGPGDLLSFISHAKAAGHGPIGVVLVDRDALAGERHNLIRLARSRLQGVPFLLLAGGTIEVPEGPWTAVLMRPVSVGQIVARIENLIALAPSRSS